MTIQTFKFIWDPKISGMRVGKTITFEAIKDFVDRVQLNEKIQLEMKIPSLDDMENFSSAKERLMVTLPKLSAGRFKYAEMIELSPNDHNCIFTIEVTDTDLQKRLSEDRYHFTIAPRLLVDEEDNVTIVSFDFSHVDCLNPISCPKDPSTRKSYEFFDELNSITRYSFMVNGNGDGSIIAVPGVGGNWIDVGKAREVVEAADRKINALLGELGRL